MTQISFDRAVLRLHPTDQVAVAKIALEAGDTLANGTDSLPLIQRIPAGHKVALQPIAAGTAVLKYGQVIGYATRPIQPGEWVHSHNLGLEDSPRHFDYKVVADQPTEAPVRTFNGYRRSDGRAGTRNTIAVISTVSCSAQSARLIAAHFTPERLAAYPNVDGVVAVTHHSGCSIPEGGEAHRYLQRIISNLTRHPNIGGYVLVGLGCEVNQAAGCIPGGKPTLALSGQAEIPGKILVIQELGGIRRTVEAGIAAVEAMLPQVNLTGRTPQPASALMAALQCGGSDAWSGVTANPLVGLAVDRLVQQGGTAVLAETPEIYGAEFLLTRRVISPAVGKKLLERLEYWEQQAALLGFSIDNNPTPGNKEGGLTTIYEKSLGAVAKGGSTPLRVVYEYAEWVSERGLAFMDTPGNDPVSVAGEVAGGCNMVLFTTGRGTVFGGSLAPCIKVATRTDLAEHMAEDMDVNAGDILEGASLEAKADALFELMLEVASGKKTKSEAWEGREAEFVPWQPGGIL